MSQFLKLDAFAAISGMKISKIFRGFSLGPLYVSLRQVEPPQDILPSNSTVTGMLSCIMTVRKVIFSFSIDY